jgi:hypothetical protein
MDAGTVHGLKSIPCLPDNPTPQNHLHSLLDWKTKTFLNSWGSWIPLSLCSVVIDNLLVQISGLGVVLEERQSPVNHANCFGHMANLVLSCRVSDLNFTHIMGHLTCPQELLRYPHAIDQLHVKCPKFVRTRWFLYGGRVLICFETFRHDFRIYEPTT